MTAPRGGYRGLTRILRYNARFFLLAALLALSLGFAAWSGAPPRWASAAAVLFASLILASMAMALAVSHYVYDRSPLMRWEWLSARLTPPPGRWTVIHAGLDDASPVLRGLFPGARGRALDIFDPQEMTEPSIAAARRIESPPEPSPRATSFDLPFGAGSLDLVVLCFVAHELRRRSSRERLFAELRRTVAPEGRVVVVEHMRDLPNLLAFGLGAFHFLPRREWLALSVESGLQVREEARLTPFVRAFFLARAA